VARIRENPEAGDTDDEEVSPGFVHLPSFAGPRVPGLDLEPHSPMMSNDFYHQAAVPEIFRDILCDPK
jgi:hypothetical protein